MRRLLLSAAGLVPLALLVGCHHMAGMCDCDTTPTIACPCYGHEIVSAAPVMVPLAPLPVIGKPEPVKEPLKVMPKPKAETPDK